ncbi:M28 family peptidase [Rufibacter glacialis]|uniref:M28 family peptidase n=1 Tax=Rufibacter glacialis TaxID=1259555 RepID=A0A5M8QLD5_9BACT|nr:M28 family peptidase [Rufibacter glacialis]KAA6435794.1 M28 family peptidase [Rufibacter glacialis]GGK66619.1 hypothetical protein GCM10011405_13200 [Rufibacter glacialis]
MSKTVCSALLVLLFGPLQFLQAQSDTTLIRTHFRQILQTPGFRHHANPAALNQVADYVHATFRKHTERVERQVFQVDGQTYQNIISSFGPQEAPRLIIGAHYDVCGEQAGADDNASGTVGLLELARLLQGKSLPFRVDLVAYTLEEPPHFRTENMGSHVHAKSLADQKVPVVGMLSLEMLGYFRDEKNTQDYPFAPLKLFYGSRGNYITLVRKPGNGRFPRRFTRLYKKNALVRTKSIAAPAFIPGIDFSDHLNYWKYHIPALMLTDTAFLRNKNYHEKTDTLETLDLSRMAQALDGVLKTVLALAAEK